MAWGSSRVAVSALIGIHCGPPVFDPLRAAAIVVMTMVEGTRPDTYRMDGTALRTTVRVPPL